MADKVTKSVSFDAEADADLLRWLDHQENASAAIREALRRGIAGGVTLADVHATLSRIERRLEHGIVVGGNGGNGSAHDEPAEAAAALDALAAMG
jgi:hypothetical protein